MKKLTPQQEEEKDELITLIALNEAYAAVLDRITQSHPGYKQKLKQRLNQVKELSFKTVDQLYGHDEKAYHAISTLGDNFVRGLEKCGWEKFAVLLGMLADGQFEEVDDSCNGDKNQTDKEISVCPKCKSEHVYYWVKDGTYECDDCNEQWHSLHKCGAEKIKTDEKSALKHAVDAIYFNDRSDYLTALYQVVVNLAGIEDPSEDDIKWMFKKLQNTDESLAHE